MAAGEFIGAAVEAREAAGLTGLLGAICEMAEHMARRIGGADQDGYVPVASGSTPESLARWLQYQAARCSALSKVEESPQGLGLIVSADITEIHGIIFEADQPLTDRTGGRVRLDWTGSEGHVTLSARREE